MKELDRTTRLIIMAVAFLIVLALGYSTMKTPIVKYQLDVDKIAGIAKDTSCLISPPNLKKLIRGNAASLVIFDVRNQDDYAKEHIENALNIPVRNLLDPGNLSKLKKLKKEKITMVVYGEDALQAASPCLLLHQLGFDQVKMLMGGYQCWVNPPADSLFKGQPPSYVQEVERINPEILQKMNTQNGPVSGNKDNNEKKKETVKTTKKSGSAGGGC